MFSSTKLNNKHKTGKPNTGNVFGILSTLARKSKQFCFSPASLDNRKTKKILALGAESAGNFSVYSNGKIYLSADFEDLLEEKNFQKFKKVILSYFKKNKTKPDIILTDTHPFYKTTIWGKHLAKKYKAKHIQIQHHLAHIFSAIGEKAIIEKQSPGCPPAERPAKLKTEDCFGIACDGTGYGADEKIWGGEIFKLQVADNKLQITRVGHLENQTMISGDLTTKEPARMLIAILNKIDFSKKRSAANHSKR